MKNLLPLFSLVVLVLSSISAYAHPGHGQHLDNPQGIMHYLTSPIHLVSILLVIGLALYTAYRKGFLPIKPENIKRRDRQ